MSLMGSVAQAVDSISLHFKEPKPRVKAIARHLIDDGVLPKSRGNLAAHINEAHLALLLLAVCTAPVSADAQLCAKLWGSMPPDGEEITASFEDQERRLVLLDMLTFMISTIWSEGGNGPVTDAIVIGRFEINATRPQALFEMGNVRVEYLPIGAEKQYSGIQRVVRIPGTALRHIALSIYDGIRRGPVVPLGPRIIEPKSLSQTEPQTDRRTP
jgi:hypothetical protein